MRRTTIDGSQLEIGIWYIGYRHDAPGFQYKHVTIGKLYAGPGPDPQLDALPCPASVYLDGMNPFRFDTLRDAVTFIDNLAPA